MTLIDRLLSAIPAPVLAGQVVVDQPEYELNPLWVAVDDEFSRMALAQFKASMQPPQPLRCENFYTYEAVDAPELHLAKYR